MRAPRPVRVVPSCRPRPSPPLAVVRPRRVVVLTARTRMNRSGLCCSSSVSVSSLAPLSLYSIPPPQTSDPPNPLSSLLLLSGWIDKLQSALKDTRSYQKASSEGADANSAEWAALLKERLHKHDLEVLKELTSLLKEMEDVGAACDAEEAASLLGLTAEEVSAL